MRARHLSKIESWERVWLLSLAVVLAAQTAMIPFRSRHSYVAGNSARLAGLQKFKRFQKCLAPAFRNLGKFSNNSIQKMINNIFITSYMCMCNLSMSSV